MNGRNGTGPQDKDSKRDLLNLERKNGQQGYKENTNGNAII